MTVQLSFVSSYSLTPVIQLHQSFGYLFHFYTIMTVINDMHEEATWKIVITFYFLQCLVFIGLIIASYFYLFKLLCTYWWSNHKLSPSCLIFFLYKDNQQLFNSSCRGSLPRSFPTCSNLPWLFHPPVAQVVLGPFLPDFLLLFAFPGCSKFFYLSPAFHDDVHFMWVYICSPC